MPASLSHLFPFRKRPRPGQYLQSVGEEIADIQKGRFTCWEAVGVVRDSIWSVLNLKIQDYITQQFPDATTVMIFVEIYMVGKKEDGAAGARPKVFICSPDAKLRKRIRQSVSTSPFMINDFPDIGLGDAPTRPRPLARQVFDRTHQGSPSCYPEVYALLSQPIFGRSLHSFGIEYGSPRQATGGPILFIHQQTYQLTAGHTFAEDTSIPAPSASDVCDLDDWDFDGQDDDEFGDDANTTCSSPDSDELKAKGREKGNELRGLYKDNRSLEHDCPEVLARDDFPGYPPIEPVGKISALQHQMTLVGRLAVKSGEDGVSGLDYGLVELDGEYGAECNEVVINPQNTQTRLRIHPGDPDTSTPSSSFVLNTASRVASRILSLVPSMESTAGPRHIKIAAVTSSSALVNGSLSGTASFFRAAHHNGFQELYSVFMDCELAQGDSGSAVVDRANGVFIGHITASGLTRRHAYVVPAYHVLKDISERLGGAIHFAPIDDPNPKQHPHKSGKTDYSKIVEFGSPQYIKTLEMTKEGLTVGRQDQISNVFDPFGSAYGSWRWDEHFFKPQKFRRWNNALSPLYRMLPESSRPDRGVLHPATPPPGTNGDSMFPRFFDLPLECQLLVVSFLPVDDVLNARLISSKWNELVAFNEAEVSRNIVASSEVPLFVLHLYPPPSSDEITLHYICSVRHRLAVVSHLSSGMAKWITDLFLGDTKVSNKDFQRYQNRVGRRLVPLLFTVFHYLETVRNELLRHGREIPNRDNERRHITTRIQYRVMRGYGDELMLQVHQIFPLLVSYYELNLRPPSYLSRAEMVMRGYRSKPLGEDILGTVLSMGGLREITRLLNVNTYDKRISLASGRYQTLFRKEDYLKDRADFQQNHEIHLSDTSGVTDNVVRIQTQRWIGYTSLSLGPPMAQPSWDDWRDNIDLLPSLEQMWIPVADAHFSRQMQSVKRGAELLSELIRQDTTTVDHLFFEDDMSVARIKCCKGNRGLDSSERRKEMTGMKLAELRRIMLLRKAGMKDSTS